MQTVLDKIEFEPKYFKGVSKVERTREALFGPGEFNEVVTVHYKSWFKLSDRFVFNNKEAADGLFKDLTNIMNKKQSSWD